MLKKALRYILFNRTSPFITVATCSETGDPNAAPKLLVRYSKGCFYLADVPHGQTWENLKVNPRLAMSFVDTENLKAYRFRGIVKILDSAKHREKFSTHIDKLLNKMIVDRILEGSSRGAGHKNFISRVPKDFIIFKVKLQEIVEYGLEDIKTRKSTKKTVKIDQSSSKK